MFLKTASFVAILFACMYVSNTEAWLMNGVYHNKDFPGKCYVNKNLILSPGEVAKSPGGCSEIDCWDVDGNAQVTGCGSVGPPRNCEWDGLEDINAPFPLCCVEKFVCKTAADEVEAKIVQDDVREMFKGQVERKNRH